MKELRVQRNACTLGIWRIEKGEFYKIVAQTFYFLEFFWFNDKTVIKRKTSDICMGEAVLYNIYNDRKYLRTVQKSVKVPSSLQ